MLPGPSQLMLAVVVAAAVTAARTALLTAWPEFKDASDRSNQQVNRGFRGGACKCAHPGLLRLLLPSARLQFCCTFPLFPAYTTAYNTPRASSSTLGPCM